jgi:Mrp family chromosome partitioning ATPase
MPAGGTVSPEGDGRSVTLPLAHLLGKLRDRAEIIIVDTSPALLTADMTDFAGEVDAVVAVVRQGYASKRNVRMLAQYTESWDTQLAGTILTDVPLPSELATYYGSR